MSYTTVRYTGSTDGTTITADTSNCIWWSPYQQPYAYYPLVTKEPNKLGEFDLHLDSCGNLRVIRDGVLLQTFTSKQSEGK